MPERGDSFYVRLDVVKPESSHSGLRRARDLSKAIIEKLAGMEERYFACLSRLEAEGAPDPARRI